MNGKDLLDIMSQVDDDLITKTELPPEKSGSPISPVPARKAPSRRVYAGVFAGIAAAVIVGIGLAAWSTNGFGLLKNKEGNEITSAADTTADYPVTTTPPDTTDDYPTTAAPPMTSTTDPSGPTTTPPGITESQFDPGQVLFAPDEKTGHVPDDWESAGNGEVQLPPSLEAEILKPENRDKYFAISINISHFICVDDYLAGHKPYIPPEELAAMFEEQIRLEVYEEMDRLVNCGYNVYLLPSNEGDSDPEYVYEGTNGKYRYHVYNGYTVSCYLTGEQIRTFIANPAYGYRFIWDTEDTHIPESEAWD